MDVLCNFILLLSYCDLNKMMHMKWVAFKYATFLLMDKQVLLQSHVHRIYLLDETLHAKLQPKRVFEIIKLVPIPKTPKEQLSYQEISTLLSSL